MAGESGPARGDEWTRDNGGIDSSRIQQSGSKTGLFRPAVVSGVVVSESRYSDRCTVRAGSSGHRWTFGAIEKRPAGTGCPVDVCVRQRRECPVGTDRLPGTGGMFLPRMAAQQMMTTPRAFLLATAGGIAALIVAGALPFSFRQAVVHALTGATMPTTPRELGNTVYYGSAAAIGASIGLCAGIGLQLHQFPLWLAVFSWLALLFVFVERYMPLPVTWLMLPIGHLASIATAHILLLRHLRKHPEEVVSASAAMSRGAVAGVTAALLLGLPCSVGLPFAGGAIGPLPRLLHPLTTSAHVPAAAVILWLVFFVLYLPLALATAVIVARSWMLLSPQWRVLMIATAGTTLAVVGFNFPVRGF